MWYWPLLSIVGTLTKCRLCCLCYFVKHIPPTFKVNSHCAVCTGRPCVSTVVLQLYGQSHEVSVICHKCSFYLTCNHACRIVERHGYEATTSACCR